VVGIDVALRWLVMARKRLETQGVAAPLICACAEALPFRDGSFTRAVADSTLEHLRDQERSIAECARVLRPGGSLFVATPNRRSLGPDPHTGLPAGGWLPEALTAAYVRRKGGIPPARHLLTARSLRSLLRSAGFRVPVLGAPDVPASQRAGFGPLTKLGIDAYHAVKRIPGGGALLRQLGPLLHAAARLESRSG
jgi:SAM-dependent methyltransferase